MADWRMPRTDEGLQLAPVVSSFGQEETFDAWTRIADTHTIPISSITRWTVHFRVPVRNLGTPLIRLIGCGSR